MAPFVILSELVSWTRLRGRLWSLANARSLVLSLKAIDAACRVHKFLLPSEEGMARRANFHTDVALVRRAGLEGMAAGANDIDRVVCGMNSGLHFVTGIPFEISSIPKIRTPANSLGVRGGVAFEEKPEASS